MSFDINALIQAMNDNQVSIFPGKKDPTKVVISCRLREDGIERVFIDRRQLTVNPSDGKPVYGWGLGRLMQRIASNQPQPQS